MSLFYVHISSKNCRIPDDESESNFDDVEMDAESLSSELQGISSDHNDSPSNSRPSSRSSSRPEVIYLFRMNFERFVVYNYFFFILNLQSSQGFRNTTPTSTPPPPKQQKLKRFMDTVPKPAESEKLDGLIADFFYGCNIPFNVADSIYFKNMVKGFRPAYDSPNRRKLAGPLLDKSHENVIKRNQNLINKMGKKVVLLIDGWKNSAANRHYVVTMLATSNDEKVFLESFDFSSVRETGLNLIDVVNKSIDLAKSRYDAEIYAVLSDNAANMLCMGSYARLASLLFSTCNSHTGNLLAGDILKVKEYSDAMDKVMSVQKEFKKTSLEDRLLKAGGHKPKLACSTRWTSQRDAADSFIKNLTAMMTVSGECYYWYIFMFI